MSRRDVKPPARFQAGAAPPPRVAYQIAAASGKAPPRKEPTPREDGAAEPAKPLVPTKANAGHKVRIGTRLRCNFVGDGTTTGSVVSKSTGIRNGAPVTVWRILWDDGDEEFFSTAEILADSDLTFVKKDGTRSKGKGKDKNKDKGKAKDEAKGGRANAKAKARGMAAAGKAKGAAGKGAAKPSKPSKPNQQPGKTSRYKGVSWAKRCNRWEAQLQHEGAKHHLGYYDSEREAARAYDGEARRRRGPGATLNFPNLGGGSGSGGAAARKSAYRGVGWCVRAGRWRARLHHNGKDRHLGFYDTEREAALAFDRAAVASKEAGLVLNFPKKKGRGAAAAAAEAAAKKKASAAAQKRKAVAASAGGDDDMTPCPHCGDLFQRRGLGMHVLHCMPACPSCGERFQPMGIGRHVAACCARPANEKAAAAAKKAALLYKKKNNRAFKKQKKKEEKGKGKGKGGRAKKKKKEEKKEKKKKKRRRKKKSDEIVEYYYTLADGEKPSDVAKALGIDVQEILSLNKLRFRSLKPSSYLWKGTGLEIPKGSNEIVSSEDDESDEDDALGSESDEGESDTEEEEEEEEEDEEEGGGEGEGEEGGEEGRGEERREEK